MRGCVIIASCEERRRLTTYSESTQHFVTIIRVLLYLSSVQFVCHPLFPSPADTDSLFPGPDKDPRCVVQQPCLALRPCKNGGTCQVTAKGWRCSCPPAWQGDRCRQPRDPCLQKTPVCGDKRWGCKRAPDKPAGFICDCNAKGWGPRSGTYRYGK